MASRRPHGPSPVRREAKGDTDSGSGAAEGDLEAGHGPLLPAFVPKADVGAESFFISPLYTGGVGKITSGSKGAVSGAAAAQRKEGVTLRGPEDRALRSASSFALPGARFPAHLIDAPISRVLIAFDTPRFLIILLYHLLYPISIPFMLCTHGKQAVHNMSLFRLSLKASDVIPLCVARLLVLLFLPAARFRFCFHF